MKFLIVTYAPTLKKGNSYFSYAPYVNEMNIWSRHVSEVGILSPTSYPNELLITSFNKSPKLFPIASISFNTIGNVIKSIFKLPVLLFSIYKAMKWADHIHLRCPGNIGLLGSIVQVFFPKKIKTAKYAGNWDPSSRQPISYKMQKWLLSNTWLTKNMQVLVYGDWPNQTKNIKSFFTATYRKDEIETVETRNYKGSLQFLFVGSLVEGKRPLLAFKIIEAISRKRKDVKLDVYGDGVLRNVLQKYIKDNDLDKKIILHGNQDKTVVKASLKKAHFLILPSKSEGWPKVLAEAMFFGAIPISTRVSCVPYMLDFGNRGVLIEPEVELAFREIMKIIDTEDLEQMSHEALDWSHNFTLDNFEIEIKKLLIGFKN